MHGTAGTIVKPTEVIIHLDELMPLAETLKLVRELKKENPYTVFRIEVTTVNRLANTKNRKEN